MPHREFGRADGIYVDIARDVTVAPDVAAFNDLFLDLMITREGVREKDEELLVRLSASEAAHVRAVRDELRERITKGEPAFDLDAALWLLPAGADRMKPLDFGPAT